MKPLLSILFLTCMPVMGEQVDSDRADREAYKDGWADGDDGSSSPASLGGWVLGENAKEPNIAIASSSGLGTGKTDIDTGGVAFKLHDPTGGNVDVFRFIDPTGLENGESLAIDLAVNFRGGYKGIDARDGDGATVFNFNVGGDDHVVDKATTGNGSIGNTYAAHTTFVVTFKQDDERGGTWTVVRGGGVTATASGRYSGRIRSLKIYNGGQGAEPENALYFNNLRVLPASEVMWFRRHAPGAIDTKVRLATPLLLAAALVSCDRGMTRRAPSAVTEAGQVYLVDDYPGNNDREKINNAFAAMEDIEGGKTLRFSKREYLVRPASKDSFEPVLGASNISNLTIDGGGATWVALDSLDCRKGYFLRIRNFTDLEVKNLSLVYRPAPFVQGRIVNVDQPENRTTIALDPSFDDVTSLVQTPMSKLWCRVGQNENPRWPKQGNPSWMDVGVDDSGGLISEPAGSGRVTVRAGFFDRSLTLGGGFNWQAGDPIVIWKRGAQDGLCFEQGSGLSLTNVRVESALHYAIKLRGVIGAAVTECHVAPAPGAMISSSADGIDVQQSRDVVIERCFLVATGDDAISFLNHGHGDNGQLFETRFGAPYPDTNENVAVRENLIEGGNRNAILLLASKAEISGNIIRHTRQYGIKFTGDDTRIVNNRLTELGSFTAYRHITDELDTGVFCSDEWTQHGASIRGNVVEDWHHMPAVLLKSVTNARVSDNTFVMSDPQRVSETPFNPYLKTTPAICVTRGHLKNETVQSSNIAIDGNVFRSGGAWRDAAEALVIHGSHHRIEAKNNSNHTISSDDSLPDSN